VQLALTVDVEARDHPCREGNFRAMVDALVSAGAPATLFVQGGWVEGRATDDELAALGADGMEIGLHGHTHRRFPDLSTAQIADELRCAEAALVAVGFAPARPLFRFPYLAGNTDAAIRTAVRAHGWEHVDCHAIAYDWLDELRDDPGAVARHARNGIEDRRAAGAENAIVLLHSWPDPTPHAVRRLLTDAREQGDDLVPVSALPRADWGPPPRRP
jgi:peptidoglycan/xylan/chitin deacetylase (PgdA/CDA1 family)